MIPASARAALQRFAGVWHRRRLDREMDAEFRAHLDLATDEHIRRGYTAADARRAAEREFGHPLHVREAHRAQRGLPGLESLAQDVSLALRRLRNAPLFTAVAAATLAIGIGVNTAVFSMLYAAVLRQLPVRAPEQLVRVATRSPDGEINTSFSYPMFADLRHDAAALAGVSAFAGAPVNVAVDGTTEQVRGELVSGNFFDLLGVSPAAGRLLTDADDRAKGAHPVVVLSHGYWQRRFGARHDVIGSTLTVNGHPMIIVGVSDRGFTGTDATRRVDIRVPMAMATVLRPFPPNRMENRRQQWLSIIARLRDDATAASGEAELGPLYRRLRDAELGASPTAMTAVARERLRAWSLALLPAAQGTGNTAKELGRPLRFLLAVSALVLLMACVNVANMLLARNASRRREVAIRVALGAGRRRLVRQSIIESLVLAACGALVGLPLAWAIPRLVQPFAPPDAAGVFDAPLQAPVLLFALAVSTLTGLVAGLLPSTQLVRDTASSSLRSDAPTATGGDRPLSLRGVLVVAQVAISLPLLVAGTLFVRSLQHLYDIDPGFSARDVVVAELTPSLNGYSQERLREFYREVIAATRQLPGVTAASFASDSVLSGGWDRYGIGVEGYAARDGEDMAPNTLLVSPGYFETLQMPIIAGRDLADTDVAGAPQVAVINEHMARYYFGDRSPLGRRFTLEPGPGASYEVEIVGVARDAKYVDLREETPRHLYLALAQQPRIFDLTLHARVDGDAAAVIPALRTLVAGIDRTVPVSSATTLDAQLGRSLGRDRLVAWLAGLSGLLALGLAAVGLSGVVAFTVVRRYREMGVRIALGARGRDVVGLVLRQTFGLVLAGALCGVVLAALAVGTLDGLLYAVDVADSIASGAIACALLVVVAGVAAWIPARRAGRIPAVTALRCE